MSCVKQTTKRFTARKSPAYEARDCKGATKLGNDGDKYTSTQAKDGSWRWKNKLK